MEHHPAFLAYLRRLSQIVPKKNGPCLTKTLRWKIVKLRMRTEMEEQFYTTLFQRDVIIQISTTDARSPICAERNTFLVIIILIIIFINFFIRVFSECTEAVATLLIH